MSIAQDPFSSPKPREVAPIDVYPTFRDHPNVVYHTKMLHRDQKIESSIESAKFCVVSSNKSFQYSLVTSISCNPWSWRIFSLLVFEVAWEASFKTERIDSDVRDSNVSVIQ